MPISDSGAGLIEGIVGVIQRDGKYLVIRRADGVRAPGTWCFPGGAIETGETQAHALVREMREELGIVCEPIAPCWTWEREDGRLRLYLWRARLLEGDPTPNPAEVAEVRWAARAEILAFDDQLPSMSLFFADVDVD